MNKQKYIPLIILLFFMVVFTGCTPDEELLTGDITGRITATDENGYLVDPNEISVTLENESLSFQEITDSDGRYTFKNIPMGNYDVTIEKEGYVPSERNFLIQHIGGFSPTCENFGVLEIPGFSLNIDSIKIEYKTYHDDLIIFGNISNMSGEPKLGYSLRVYLHTSSDVSATNYTEKIYDYILSSSITGDNFQFPVEAPDFYQPGDTVYFRIYPIALVSDWYSRDDILGPPSEVFVWEAK
jgi:hypothetical protein